MFKVGNLSKKFTICRHRPYDEVNRLGLQRTTEELVRNKFPEGTGMLCVEEITQGISLIPIQY